MALSPFHYPHSNNLPYPTFHNFKCDYIYGLLWRKFIFTLTIFTPLVLVYNIVIIIQNKNISIIIITYWTMQYLEHYLLRPPNHIFTTQPWLSQLTNPFSTITTFFKVFLWFRNLLGRYTSINTKNIQLHIFYWVIPSTRRKLDFVPHG